MGAGGIAAVFCRAVKGIPDAEVCAVSSKSLSRAGKFASDNDVPSFYGSYKEMLEEEKPDCVYIATTPDSHFNLTMLCLERDIPVLCEKAMFVNSSEAEAAFALSEEKNVFCMEATWSRLTPSNRKAVSWIKDGRIGFAKHIDISIGFKADMNPEARYMNKSLGGGASTDITIYAYELALLYAGKPLEMVFADAEKAYTGVDLTDRICLSDGKTTANLFTTFASKIEEKAVIYGTDGKIVLPFPHCGNEAFLYDGNGCLTEHFTDRGPHGFTYEINETIRCIKEGRYESPAVPHSLTLSCARMFDEIYRVMK